MSESDLSDWETRRDAKAERLGMEIRYPGPNELFIDIDDRDGLKAFHSGIGLMGSRYPDLIAGWKRTPSNGGGDHWHIRVELSRPVEDQAERIAMQVLLGSDRKRELLSWLTQSESPNVTCFFEKPVF